MTHINRRNFLVASALVPIGCAIDHHRDAPADPAAEVRAPALGQSWRYAKHDYYTKAVLDIQVDQVAAVGRTIEITSRTEGRSAKHSPGRASWGLDWLRAYADKGKPPVELPGEVQSPWGMLLVDPHWNQVQVYKTPVPLWPRVLRAGWHANINTRYKTSDEGDGYPWDQTMRAEAWENITVPAGTFRALRYANLINFRSSDPTRGDSMRHETLWLAPQVGRWVARESAGSFYVEDSAVDQPYNETSFRWELLEWT